MSQKEDPLKYVYFLRLFDWTLGNVLLNKLVYSSTLLFLVCLSSLGLYRARKDRDELFINLMVLAGFSPCIAMALGHMFTITDFTQFCRKADEMSRSIRSEGPKTYDRIIRISRKVTICLWGYFFFSIFVVTCLLSSVEIRSRFSMFNLMGGYQILEEMLSVIIMLVWVSPMIGLSVHARWCHYILVQMILLESNISNRLDDKIKRTDKARQKLCKRHLSEVVMFHSDIKSIAVNYFQIVRLHAILIFYPTLCTITMSVIFFFTNKCKEIRLVMGLSGLEAVISAYIAVMNAQSIIDESEQLGDMLYSCPWYDWNKNNCTALIIIMSQIKESLLKTEIFGMFEINYKMFLKMLRLSYGLITVVFNLK